MKDSFLESSAAFVGPVGSEGGRSPSTLSIGQALPAGGLAPGQRWSVGRKREVVRGESIENLSRELGVPSYRLERGASVLYRGSTDRCASARAMR
jgi:transposase